MPPSTSHSPRRKRVRRHFSASATSGHRWKAVPFATTSSNRLRRRESSPSSAGAFTFSQDDESGDSELEDDVSRVSASEDNILTHAQTFAGLSQLDRPPLTYASLPPTPISSSPPPPTLPPAQSRIASSSSRPPEKNHEEPPFSLWDYLREELLATDFDSHQELKWERVSNFLHMPYAMEKVRQGSLCIIRLIPDQ